MLISLCLGQTVWAFAINGHASKAFFDAITVRRMKTSSSDVLCFNAAISACEKAGFWLRAAPVPIEMRSKCPTPVAIYFNAILSCEKDEKWQRDAP
eukprot:12358888-Karenia_brevis.AAC.1